MINIEIPSFLSVRGPKYNFEGGEKIPALRFFPPFIRPELYVLLSEDAKSKKLADTFNRFVIITFFAILCAGFGAVMSAFAYRYFFFKVFFYPTFLLLAMSLISNFMAWFNFRRMAEAYLDFSLRKKELGINFTHFEISENGVFKRETGTRSVI